MNLGSVFSGFVSPIVPATSNSFDRQSSRNRGQKKKESTSFSTNSSIDDSAENIESQAELTSLESFVESGFSHVNGPAPNSQSPPQPAGNSVVLAAIKTYQSVGSATTMTRTQMTYPVG